MKPINELYLRRKQAGALLVALTAYDYPTARLVDESGVDLILVGDSLGMVVLGLPDTTTVSLAAMVHHTEAAARGVTHATLVADLPKDAYLEPAQAVANAQTLMAVGAHAVKLEGGREHAATIAALVAAGIPVLAHIGMLPQHIHEEGGYRIKGRTPRQAEDLLADARAVQVAGAFAVVLELVTPPLAREISATLAIPTLGIGSGEGCDGQIRVLHDVIGLYPWFRPKFVEAKADVAGVILQAVRAYAADVRETPAAEAVASPPNPS